MAFPRYGSGSSSGFNTAPVLLDQPGQSTPPSIGTGGVRTRSRRVSGPNAMSRYKPLKSDLPLKPNGVTR